MSFILWKRNERMKFVKLMLIYISVAGASFLSTGLIMQFLNSSSNGGVTNVKVKDKGYWGVDNELVVVYSAEWCPSCSSLKSYLKEKDIVYKNFDIDENSDAKEKLLDRSKKIPLIIVNDTMIEGFNKKALEKVFSKL